MRFGAACLFWLSGCVGGPDRANPSKDREIAELRSECTRRREALEEALKTQERLGQSLRLAEAEKSRLLGELARQQTEGELCAERESFLDKALKAREERVLALEAQIDRIAQALKEAHALQREILPALESSARATAPPPELDAQSNPSIEISTSALQELHSALNAASARLSRAVQLANRALSASEMSPSPEAPKSEDFSAVAAVPISSLAGSRAVPRPKAGGLSPSAGPPAGRPGASGSFWAQFYGLVRSHFSRLFEPGRTWDGADFGFLGAILIAAVAAYLILATPFRWMLREMRERELSLLRSVVSGWARSGSAAVPSADQEPPPEEAHSDAGTSVEEAEPLVVIPESPAPKEAQKPREEEPQRPAAVASEPQPEAEPQGPFHTEVPDWEKALAAVLEPASPKKDLGERAATQALPNAKKIAADVPKPAAPPREETSAKTTEESPGGDTQAIQASPEREKTTPREPAAVLEFAATQEIAVVEQPASQEEAPRRKAREVQATESVGAPPAPKEGEASSTRPLPTLAPVERTPTEDISKVRVTEPALPGDLVATQTVEAEEVGAPLTTQNIPEVYGAPGERPAGAGKRGEKKHTQPVGYRDHGVVLSDSRVPAHGPEIELHATQVIPDVLLGEPEEKSEPAPQTPERKPAQEPTASPAPAESGEPLPPVSAAVTEGIEDLSSLAPGPPPAGQKKPRSEQDLLAEIEALLGRKLGPKP